MAKRKSRKYIKKEKRPTVKSDFRAEESLGGYSQKPLQLPDNSIAFATSFAEMNEADAIGMAALSGVEHLGNATALIKRIFSEELKSKSDHRIHFGRS